LLGATTSVIFTFSELIAWELVKIEFYCQ